DRDLSQSLARRRQGLQGEPEEGVRRDLLVLHVEGIQDVVGDVRQGAGHRRRGAGLPARSRALHEAPRRGAAEGKENQGDPGFQENGGDRIHGQGAFRPVGPPSSTRPKEETTMAMKKDGLTRRQYLAATGSVLALGSGVRPVWAADVTLRQGY